MKLKRKAGRIWFTGLKPLHTVQQLFRTARETTSKDLGWSPEAKAAAAPSPDWSVTALKLLLCFIQSGVERKYFDMESGTQKQTPNINFRITFPLSENYQVAPFLFQWGIKGFQNFVFPEKEMSVSSGICFSSPNVNLTLGLEE